MSWGVYGICSRCPACGRKFKSGADTITDPSFGVCPACRTEGELIGESDHQVGVGHDLTVHVGGKGDPAEPVLHVGLGEDAVPSPWAATSGWAWRTT